MPHIAALELPVLLQRTESTLPSALQFCLALHDI